jgi:DNA polymerase I-like protein with 3'-5' exonuclease and polymerase domains
MISFFTNPDEVFDGDFHSFSATMIARNKTGDNTLVYSKSTHPKERNISKTITFANAYGASPFSLQFSLETDLENATKFIEDYFNGFPGLKENFEKTKQIALTRGWVQLDAFTDRRYFYPDFDRIAITREKALSLQPENWRFMSKEAKAEWKLQNPEYAENWKNHAIYKGRLERISLNYRIQGLAAGMSKLALCLIHRSGIYLILAVHDEILAIGSKEDANFISQAMIDAGKYFCKRVPMGADPAFGDYWIH